MGTGDATARRENSTTQEAIFMDTACVTTGVHSEGMERLREVCEGKGIRLFYIDGHGEKSTVYFENLHAIFVFNNHTAIQLESCMRLLQSPQCSMLGR